MIEILKSKRAATMQTWVETIVISVALVVLMGLVISDMNEIHGKDNSLAGLPTDSYKTAIDNYQENMNEKTTGGEVSFLSALGLTLSTSWDIIVSTTSLLWGFIAGNWISTILIDYMGLPIIIGWALRSIFYMAIGFLILKILFRIKA